MKQYLQYRAVFSDLTFFWASSRFIQWERKLTRAIVRLAQQFPNDPGAMAPLFLNYLLMAPGESFFLAANEPHAYVAGEIIEVCEQWPSNALKIHHLSILTFSLYSIVSPVLDVLATLLDCFA